MILFGMLWTAVLTTAHPIGLHESSASAPVVVRDDEAVRQLVADQIRPLIEAERFPGASVGVLKDGETFFFGFGGTGADGSGPVPDEHTLYEIGSITKVFTAVLLAEAAEAGEVSLDTPLAEAFPDDREAPQLGEHQIELWHLATHSSGLPAMPANMRPTHPAQPFAGYSSDLMYDFLEAVTPARPPETGYEYSNLATGLLGRLLEARLGVPYEQLLATRIFSPAGMQESSISIDEANEARIAQPSAEGLTASRWNDMDALAPCGAIVSSASDLLRFAAENIEPTDPESTLARALAAAHQPRFTDPRSGTTVGLGWHLAGDEQTLWHNGMTGGYSSMLLVNIPERLAVVVLANGATMDTTAAGDRIMRSLLGDVAPPPEVEPSIDVSEEHLERLVGEYESPLGFTIYVTREGDRLGARLTGQTRFRIYPDGDGVAPARFKYRVVPAALAFDLPAEGSAAAVTLEQNGQKMRAQRRGE